MTHDVPSFTSRTAHEKTTEMVVPTPPPLYVQRFLGGLPSRVRVLDIGCGRGDTVAWLLDRGWNAQGVDVNEEYVRHGRDYLVQAGHDPQRLHVGFPFPFHDGEFDVVLSDQVIEHVLDIRAFATEVGRVSASGAMGLHIFPAKWRPIEVHLGVVAAHWLPKGRLRRLAVAANLRLGIGVKGFEDLTREERVEVFTHFSDSETFYRSPGLVAASFESAGISANIADAASDKVRFELRRHPLLALLARPGALVYRHAFSVVLQTCQR